MSTSNDRQNVEASELTCKMSSCDLIDDTCEKLRRADKERVGAALTSAVFPSQETWSTVNAQIFTHCSGLLSSNLKNKSMLRYYSSPIESLGPVSLQVDVFAKNVGDDLPFQYHSI